MGELGTAYARTVLLSVDGQPVELTVAEAGLACCAVEVAAALSDPTLAAAASSGDATRVLLVSGTVTDVLAPAVHALWSALPKPVLVLSFGACSNSGGPYWDSYSVTKGVDQLLPVDGYVPGCPPRPDALLDGLRTLLRAEGPPG
jgi:NADH-quinone oxidoreductase subunit B